MGMKLIIIATFVLASAATIMARPGDTYNCNGGYWVVMDEVAKCVQPNSTVPPGTIPGTLPLPTPAYTAEPLYPDCKPIEKQTPTETPVHPYRNYMPIVANQ